MKIRGMCGSSSNSLEETIGRIFQNMRRSPNNSCRISAADGTEVMVISNPSGVSMFGFNGNLAGIHYHTVPCSQAGMAMAFKYLSACGLGGQRITLLVSNSKFKQSSVAAARVLKQCLV